METVRGPSPDLVWKADAMTIVEPAAVSTATTCTIDGCGKPHKAHGWCNGHYRRWQRTGTTDAPPPPRLVCSIEGCEEPHKAQGWCNSHYRNWQRHGDPLGGRPRADVPTYRAVHKRLCTELHPSMLRCAHCGAQAQQWAYDHSDPDELRTPEGVRYSVDPRRYIPLCQPCHVRFDRPSGPCSVDGCGKPQKAHGWCNTHYRRWQRHGDSGPGRAVAPDSATSPLTPWGPGGGPMAPLPSTAQVRR